jgi:hypothetical protein
MLELVLGTPFVFALPPATRAALDRALRLRARPEGERARLYQLRGMMELCVYPPRVGFVGGFWGLGVFLVGGAGGRGSTS